MFPPAASQCTYITKKQHSGQQEKNPPLSSKTPPKFPRKLKENFAPLSYLTITVPKVISANKKVCCAQKIVAAVFQPMHGCSPSFLRWRPSRSAAGPHSCRSGADHWRRAESAPIITSCDGCVCADRQGASAWTRCEGRPPRRGEGGAAGHCVALAVAARTPRGRHPPLLPRDEPATFPFRSRLHATHRLPRFPHALPTLPAHHFRNGCHVRRGPRDDRG